MIIANQLPKFLWEHATAHAVYVHNHAFTRSLGNITPHQTWFKKRPNVSHLQEFSVPMWILLQGKKEPPKMQSKSQWHLYVSFDNRSNSVLYYNTKMRKILKSQNYCFLTPLQQNSPPEKIEVTPNLPCEGEKESGTWSSGDSIPGTSDKRKLDNEKFEPRKT